MAITERDQNLLEGLGQFRVLTISQIGPNYFGGLARPLVQRRLGRLRAEGFLRAYPFGAAGALAWTLTSDGARFVGKAPRIFCRPPNRNTLPHDLTVAEVGLKLRQLGLLHDWVGACEIESSNGRNGLRHLHVPDAVFRIRVGDEVLGPVGLEVEHSLKTRARIEEMFRHYRSSIKVTDLWLFWRKDWMGRTFRELKPAEKPRIWVASQSIREGVELCLDGLAGERLDLERLASQPKIEADTPSDTAARTQAFDESVTLGRCEASDPACLRTRGTPPSTALITHDPTPTTTGESGVMGGSVNYGVQGEQINSRGLEGGWANG